MDALHKAAIAVGGATAVSGLGLIAAPRLVLCILGAGQVRTGTVPVPDHRHVHGRVRWVARRRQPAPRPRTVRGGCALRWALAAKIGAAIAVWCGVRSKRFGKQALALAAFDASAAGLIAAVMLKDA